MFLGTGITVNNSTLGALIIRDSSTITNSHLGSIKVKRGNLTWQNSTLPKPGTLPCTYIRIRDEVILKKVFATTLKSLRGTIQASECDLNKIEARDGISLQNTLAKIVQVSRGPLKLENNFPINSINYPISSVYELLKARDGIQATNVNAAYIDSKGLITANNCTFDHVNGVQTVNIQNSHIKNSLTVKINPVMPYEIILSNTTIDYDIIIDLIADAEEDCSMRATNVRGGMFGSAGTVFIGNVVTSETTTIHTGKNYRSLEEVPIYYLLDLALWKKEGTLVDIDNLHCVVENGKLKLRQESRLNPLTWEQVKREINYTFGPGCSVSRLEYRGGVFDIINGTIRVITPPPGLTVSGEQASPVSLPKVTVEIRGGLIKGKVQFKNCQGTVNLSGGAIIEQQAEIFSIPQPLAVEVKNEEEIPDEYVDCISFKIMINPYKTPEYRSNRDQNIIISHIFDHSTLVNLSKGTPEFVCPLTRNIYKLADCKPVKELKTEIDAWKITHPDAE